MSPIIQIQNEHGIKEDDIRIGRIHKKASFSSFKPKENSLEEINKNFAEVESEFTNTNKTNSSSHTFRKSHNAQLSLDINVNRNYDPLMLNSSINTAYTTSNVYSSYGSPSVNNIQNFNFSSDNHGLLSQVAMTNSALPSNIPENTTEYNYEELMFDGPVSVKKQN